MQLFFFVLFVHLRLITCFIYTDNLAYFFSFVEKIIKKV